MTLWRFFRLEKMKLFPHRRINKKHNPIQRASFCTCFQGSYTIEAAVIIPLVAAYLVILLWFFIILELQESVNEAVLYAGRKTAVESSVVESEELLFLSTEAYMWYALQDNMLVKRYIENGFGGISLWDSNFEGEDIYIRAEYTAELPFSIGNIGSIRLSSQNYFRKWIGDYPKEEKGYVYITKSGEVYHIKLSCRSINRKVNEGSIEEISKLRGKDGQRYYECSHCEWKDSKKERIYYTDYGTLYHKDIGCNAIKRQVEKIPIDEVGERRPCSFCCEE